MSKIIRAINAMIANPEKISNIFKKEKEYYFLYDKKYKWSISYIEDQDRYYVYYYPESKSLENISTTTDWGDEEFLVYKSEDFNSQEAIQTFKELYLIIKERQYGIDKVLDEIIKDEESPFWNLVNKVNHYNEFYLAGVINIVQPGEPSWIKMV